MACETETKIIDGIEYSCTQYSAKKGAIFKLRVMKMFGPSVKKLLPALPTKAKNKKENSTAIDQVNILLAAMNALFEKADPEEIIDLIWQMLGTGNTCRDEVKLSEATLDQYFSGNDLSTVYKVFIFVLKVNYADFFKGQRAKEALAAVEVNL